MTALTHIVGPPVSIDGLLRQRCAWCGTMLDEVHLDQVAVAVEPGQEPGPFPTWPEGAQMRVDGGLRSIVQPPEPSDDGVADLVADSCALLPHELTGTPTEAADR